MRRLRTLSVFGLVLFWTLFPYLHDDAHAAGTWGAVRNGNVVGNSIQFDYRGGNATYTDTVPDGSTVTITINNTIANCIGVCTPMPDNWTLNINGQSYSGNTIEIRTITATVSGALTIYATGIDAGFWGGWYGPIFSVTIDSPAPVVVISPEPTATPSETPQPDSPTVSASPSPQPSDSATVSTPSPEPSSSTTPESSTQTIPTQSPSPEPTQSSQPTPSPSPSPNYVSGSANEGWDLSLSAPIGKIFTAVIFGSYGTPNNYTIGSCHAPNTVEKIAEIFLGRAIATIMAINDIFGDPCGGTYKRLEVTLAYGDDPAATPSPSPSSVPSETPTAESSPTPSASPEPTQAPAPSTPEPTPAPEPSPSPTPVPAPAPSPTPEPVVIPTPVPSPTPSPSDSPSAEPTPVATPEPSESPSPQPEPSPSPTESPSPDPVPSPTPEPSRTPEPSPSASPSGTPEPSPKPEPQPSTPPSEQLTDILADGEVSAKEVDALVENVLADGKMTEAEKEIVVTAVLTQFQDEPVPASALAEAGITYADLPPETPVETRTDADGNPVVITAEVADALQAVENPAALVGAIFTNPAKALLALANIGADMSPQEREESQKVVVAAVVVSTIASISIRRM